MTQYSNRKIKVKCGYCGNVVDPIIVGELRDTIILGSPDYCIECQSSMGERLGEFLKEPIECGIKPTLRQPRKVSKKEQ